MDNYILAGVGVATAFTRSEVSPQLICTSRTLTDEGLNLGVSTADIRGGLGNSLVGQYFYDTILNLTMTDALFNLQYLALNVGGNITVGGDSLVTESITTMTANTITVAGTPVEFGNAGTVGWWTYSGKDDWQALTFEGQTATVANLPAQSEICVRYNAYNDALREFVIPAAVIPSEVHMILTYPLFSAGTGVKAIDFSSSSQVGNLIVDIPRFLFSGTVDLALTSSGATSTPLSGAALAYYQTTNCNQIGLYATVKEEIFGRVWSDNLKTMGVVGADVELTVGESTTLKVYGIYNDNATGIINNANLTFTSDGTGFTVNNAGTIIATEEGTGTVKIVATPTATFADPIECYAKVTITRA